MSYTIKPNKSVFVYYNFLKSLLGVLVVLGIAIVALIFISGMSGGTANLFLPVSPEAAIALVVVLAALFLVYKLFALFVAYRKTSYEFGESKTIVNTGTIFSNSSTELVTKNITHVKMVKPFIKNKLFGIGHILVELAGSSSVEGRILYIDKPENIYEKMAETMKRNGFSLSKQNLIQKEKPSRVAVFFEVAGAAVITLAALSFFALNTIIMLFVILPSFLGIPILAGILSLAAALIVLKYMNLIKRKYFVYEDTIVYEEGFLTKVYSFMPAENLADSEVTQNFLEKIFSLYDVKISSQGASHEILFKNLANGKKMEENIDGIVKSTKSLVGTASKKISEEVAKMKLPPGKITPPDFETQHTAQTKMEFGRTIASPLIGVAVLFAIINLAAFALGPSYLFMALPSTLGLAVLFIIFSLVSVTIVTSATKYMLLERGVAERFSFLNTKNVEFSNDKITGLIFKKSFVDDWFNTFSATFWSIGSSSNVSFKNVNFSEDFKKRIREKLGFGTDKELYSLNSEMSLPELLKANLGLVVLAAIAVVVLSALSIYNPVLSAIPVAIVIVSAIIAVYKKAFYKTTQLVFTEHFVFYKEGIFFRKEYYALYDNIKDITTIRYPFSDYGTLKFNVAGEAIIKTQNQGSQIIPHAFEINYAGKIFQKDELIDIIFYRRPSSIDIAGFEKDFDSFSSKNILAEKPSLKNPLFKVLLAGGLTASAISAVLALVFPLAILPVAALLVLVVLFVALKTRVITYMLQPYRVVAKSGILWKKQTSIIFTKIDHLRNMQGFTNKLFKNGSITVHTTGSSLPEIVITNIKNYRELYEKLEQFYS